MCLYTSTKNGVAEWKNRHLVETTRTLLIHGGVPQRFWGDVILSTCYLINRMLSSVLNNKIPHSILFPHEPLHLLPLKVFGSGCFVHNFGLGIDKLSTQSHKCVFLGFTRSQKGYKCFSPSLNRHLISAYVTFIESSFYFKSLSSPPVSPSNQVHITIVFDTLNVSSVSKDSSHPPPLQVYSPSNDSLLVPALLPPPTLIVEPNLPIAIRKGICYTCNPSPHYTALSYQRLS